MEFAKKAAILRDRAHMLQQVRAFFSKRRVLEVDCCSLVRCPPLDANVEVMEASVSDQETGYLHTSPEYAMKRLLAYGLGDIFYMGHVFRKGEIGQMHNPEFTMIEWYRTSIPYQSFIEETCELIQLFTGSFPIRTLSYRDAFQNYAGIDPFAEQDYSAAALSCGLVPPPDSDQWDRDTWLHLLMSQVIEPNLGSGELTVLCEYPPSQAALARVVEKDNIAVAERFEIYLAGIELCNGYHELSDPQEQRRRFTLENKNRGLQGKELYALDEKFLGALEIGLPDSCGVSVGFDRLMVIRHKVKALRDILPFAWDDL
ncbi:MAG: genX [Parachlamydiales bacterium]|nr:genX [Parachlamydiales bacterium]